MNLERIKKEIDKFCFGTGLTKEQLLIVGDAAFALYEVEHDIVTIDVELSPKHYAMVRKICNSTNRTITGGEVINWSLAITVREHPWRDTYEVNHIHGLKTLRPRALQSHFYEQSTDKGRRNARKANERLHGS